MRTDVRRSDFEMQRNAEIGHLYGTVKLPDRPGGGKADCEIGQQPIFNIRRPRPSFPDLLFPLLLPRGHLGQGQEFLGDQLQEIVDREDPLQPAARVDHRQAPHPMGPHPLEDIPDALLFPGGEQLMAHDITGEDGVQVDFAGNDGQHGCRGR